MSASIDFIKICGLSDTSMVTTACEHGATHLGFMIYESSPRYISVSRAAELVASVSDCDCVAVTVDADDKLLDDITMIMRPSMLQLHGCESVSRISSIRSRYNLPIIKALGISSSSDLDSLSVYESHSSIDYLLLDYKPLSGDSFGGIGESFDWSIISSLSSPKPLILAGGISFDNLGEALDIIVSCNNSFIGLDVSSSLESSRGVKDIKLIEQFLRSLP